MLLGGTLLLGACVGFALAVTGAGGGILAVPLLTLGLHLSLARSAPIALLAVGLAAALGAALGLREGRVRYRAALLIGGAGMVLAPAGVWLAHSLPEGLLTMAFALVMAASSIVVLRRGGASGTGLHPQNVRCTRNAATGRFFWTWPCVAIVGCTGMVSGVLNGLLGVGGGFVIVPALARYSDLTMQSIVCTSQAVIALVSLSSIVSAASRGGMDWDIAIPFAAGAMSSMVLGRELAARMAGARLQRNFACLSGVVAVLLLVRGLTGSTN